MLHTRARKTCTKTILQKKKKEKIDRQKEKAHPTKNLDENIIFSRMIMSVKHIRFALPQS